MKPLRMPTYRPGTRGAAEIARDAMLTEPAHALLVQTNDAALFVALLIENRRYADAIRFTGHRLPRAAALWWGCLCIWEVARAAPTPAVEAALQCIIDWLREPTDELRRQAETVANDAGLDTPAGLLALAVFMNGGSIAPPELPNVAPRANMTPTLAANAVLMASRSGSSEATLQRQFLEIARDVLDGRSHWKP